ncbi:hypothetical protein Fmac_011086 [Flemingia macrophylla]|uniref:Protein kinase domain-containing protein n=1 Tax=Flemingia macrophylla TaxID=520843 RepID=A0ABD1MLF5_9FABA
MSCIAVKTGEEQRLSLFRGVRIMFLKCFGPTNSCNTGRSSGKGYPTVIEELCHPFSLADLKKATNNFHSSRLIAFDGYAFRYKGYLQHDDSSHYPVLLKRFTATSISEEQFKTEIELLCQLRHPNIISVIGFCNTKREKIIVYEDVPNGSLQQGLPTLSWKKRLEICIGAARGLHYLHAGAKRTIVHRDIKPSSILLDGTMHPKLMDFGFCVLGANFMSKPKPIQVEYAVGGFGYLAPEHMIRNTTTTTVTDKSDVYSFGVVLLRAVLEKRFSTQYEGQINVEENIDENIKGKIAPQCWQVFMDITQRCIKIEPDERPTMGEVEVELEHALSLQEQADISNTDGHYILLSETIVDRSLERTLWDQM